MTLARSALAAAALLMFSACGAEDAGSAPGETTTGQSMTTSSSQTSTRTSTSATTSPSASTTAANHAPAPTAVPQPTLVECIYGGGAWTDSGLMSDGSFRPHPRCAALRAEQLAKYPYVCPRTDHHVADLSECGPPVHIPEVDPEPTMPSPAAPEPPPAVEAPVGEQSPAEAPSVP